MGQVSNKKASNYINQNKIINFFQHTPGGAMQSFISGGRMDKSEMSSESFYYFYRN